MKRSFLPLLAVVSLLSACGELENLNPPDQMLKDSLGLTDQDRVHRVILRSLDQAESIEPTDISVEPGSYLEFLTRDRRVRVVSFLMNELAPEPTCELPHSLAAKLGVRSGDPVKVTSARGELVVKAVVTRRMQSLRIAGQEVTIVWMPYNWGFKGLSTGPSVNVLTIDALDPGAGTQETKACLVNVVRVGEGIASR